MNTHTPNLSGYSAFVLALLFSTGCSGGGAKESIDPSTDTTAPVVEVLFPQPGCLVAGPQVTVRGTCSDASAVVAVSVNGIGATSSDGFVNWQVDLTVASGTNDLVVSASDSEGNSDSGAASVSVECSGFLWVDPVKMDLDTATGRLYVLDSELDSIVRVDLITGHRTLLAGTPTDDLLSMALVSSDIAFDPVFNRALIVDRGWAAMEAIVGVDLITGDRTLLSGAGVGAGPALPSMYNISVTADGLTAYVTDDDTVLAVNLGSGARTILSDPSTGSGPPLASGDSAHLDESGNRLFIADKASDQLFAVDLTTGDRTILSDETYGAADQMFVPVDVGYDPIGNQAYVTENGGGPTDPSLLRITLATGEQTVVSDETTGAGIPFLSPVGVEWDLSGGRALVLDGGRNSVVAVHRVNGKRGTLSALSVGSGSGEVGAGAIVQDVANQRLICSTSDRLIAVDLLTGDRSVFMDYSLLPEDGINYLAHSSVSGRTFFDDSDWGTVYVFDSEAGTVAPLCTPETSGMVVDDTNGVLLAIQSDELVMIDMSTGVASSISGMFSGSGPAFSEPLGLAVNAAGTLAWTLDFDLEALFQVDLATGARTIVADSTTGTGESMENISNLVVDETLGLAYVTRHRFKTTEEPAGLLVVDLETGDRVLMEQDSQTSRSSFGRPFDIVRDRDSGLLYLSDSLMRTIVVVDPITGCNGVRSAE